MGTIQQMMKSIAAQLSEGPKMKVKKAKEVNEAERLSKQIWDRFYELKGQAYDAVEQLSRLAAEVGVADAFSNLLEEANARIEDRLTLLYGEDPYTGDLKDLA